MMSRVPRLPASTLVAAALASIFIVLNGINALRKGGDCTVFLEAGERFLQGAPLYTTSGVGAGIVGPPFQGLFFAPFALIAYGDERAARLAWYVANLGALGLALLTWIAVLSTFLDRPIRWRGWRSDPAMAVLLSLLASAFPLQTNFEHQNMNLVLLALTGAAAWAIAGRRDAAGGILLGIAAALKAFPALLLVYLLIRRKWRAAAFGVMATVVLTLLSALRFGPDVGATIRDWLEISATGGWPVRGHNQSLFAMFARAFGPEDALATGHLWAADHPRIHGAWMATALALAAVTLAACVRWQAAADPGTPAGFAPMLALAVLLSPIAWDHYWVLLFPAFLYLALARDRARWVPWAFWIAAILTSGFSRAIVGAEGLAMARWVSVFTWAAIILLASTLALHARLTRAGRSETGP
jgi:alpha-1,2-mannosyltransferase